MRHFWWNAGDASDRSTVPCIPFTDIEKTA